MHVKYETIMEIIRLYRNHHAVSDSTLDADIFNRSPAEEEFKALWFSLPEIERQELIALMWMGRDEDPPEEFEGYVADAKIHIDEWSYFFGKLRLPEYLNLAYHSIGG